ncbi:hypothetical protein THS27_21425 [Thalassospira sp. MCCC 1A01428]|nr:hypothetical protein THS27_21425 [Thalassospira sp. MCCC 1A01428]
MRQIGTQVSSMTVALQERGVLRSHALAKRFAPHFHNTYSVVALKQGSAEIKSRRWTGTAGAREVFFFNPYEVHSAHCPIQDTEYTTLYLTENFVAQCLDLELRDRVIDFENLIPVQGYETQELCDALFTPQTDGKFLELALRRLLTTCKFSIRAASKDSGTLVQRACSLIQQNATQAIKTEELAHKLGVHKSHLVRSFSKIVGIPPQTYLRQVRIAKAKELICEGLALSEIAAFMDFSDQAHFTREFKKVFGVPPGSLSRDICTPQRKDYRFKG